MSTAAEAAGQFAKLLRRARRAKEISLERLGELMGRSVFTVSNLERGVTGVPRIPDVMRLASLLEPEIDVEELLLLAAAARQCVEIDLAGASPEVLRLCVKLARAVEQGLDPAQAIKLSKSLKLAS